MATGRPSQADVPYVRLFKDAKTKIVLCAEWWNRHLTGDIRTALVEFLRRGGTLTFVLPNPYQEASMRVLTDRYEKLKGDPQNAQSRVLETAARLSSMRADAGLPPKSEKVQVLVYKSRALSCFLAEVDEAQLLLSPFEFHQPEEKREVESPAVEINYGLCEPELGSRYGNQTEWLLKNSMPVDQAIDEARPIRILSLDGGGTRGIMQAKILDLIEKELNNGPIADQFDMICGTSTGGIIALGLGIAKLSAADALKFYSADGPNIFGSFNWQPSTWMGYFNWRPLNIATGWPRFSAEALEGVLLRTFGAKTLKDSAKPCVFVVAGRSEIERDPTPFLFRNYDAPNNVHIIPGNSSAFLHQAARCTSAAPTYLPAARFDGMEFVDGGTMANNPTAIAVEEASRMWPNRPIYVLSIGTGLPVMAPNRWSGYLRWAPWLVSIAADSARVHEMMRRRMSDATYFRINPDLAEDIDLASIKSTKLADMLAAAEKTWKAHPQHDAVIRVLRGDFADWRVPKKSDPFHLFAKK